MKKQHIVLMLLGVLSIIMIYPILLKLYYNNWNATASIGDSFGVLNTVFSGLAFCGIIISLIIQQTEMKLQREELHSARYEYKHNRITNLAYIQLSKFEKAIENLKINECKTSIEPLQGYSAIYFLNKKLNHIYLSSDEKDVMIKEASAQKLNIEENLGIIFKSSAELSAFVLSAYNYVSTFNSIVNKSRIEEQDKDELRVIFTGNTGIELIELLNKLDYTLHFISTFPDELDPFNNFNSDLKAMNFYLGELTDFLDC